MEAITVIITTYNLERYIQTCLDQIFAQTFKDFRVLVVDDCSADRTPDIIRQYQAKYPGKIDAVFNPENMGSPSLTRNVALDYPIQTEYILFTDGDDELDPQMLEKLHASITREDADMAVCAYRRFDSATGKTYCYEMDRFPVRVMVSPLQNELPVWINAALWNKLIRRSVIGDLRLPPFRVGEDASFLLRLYQRTARICFVPDVLFHYRVHPASVISATSFDTIQLFAHELARIKEDYAINGWNPDIVYLAMFVHIGVSMAHRAYANPSLKSSEYAAWAKSYFNHDFPGWFRNPCLSLKSLSRRGVKGMALWVLKLLYKANISPVFLFCYNFSIRHLKIDIKW